MIKKALLLLGCPELPVQTGTALYLANRERANFSIPLVEARDAYTYCHLGDGACRVWFVRVASGAS